MKKQMKFLFCGFGNIMQRHFRNLKKLLPDCDISIYTHNYGDKHRIFDNNLYMKQGFLENFYFPNHTHSNLPEAIFSSEYDAIFIGTLPPDRIEIANLIAEKGENLFIEKPLSNNLNKVHKLQKIVEDKKLKCAIGYQMRFHPALQQVKKMLNKKQFGEIYRIEVTHGNNIHNWTKGRNLKDFYALDSIKGGGVVFSQSHELDYLAWLFGDFIPLDSFGNAGNNVSILGVPKFCSAPTIINLDFITKTPVRDLIIRGTKKSILVDLINGCIVDLDTNLLTKYTIEWNELFLKEMEAFIGSLTGKWKEPLAKLSNGITVLNLAIEIESKL